jgi:group I intron endonuclease
MQNGFIYKITNNLNGKIYIGKTTRPVRERFLEHMSPKGTLRTALANAVRRHGKDNFSVEIIVALPEEELDAAEAYHIDAHNSTGKHIGYNRTTGGEGGFKHMAATRKRIADATSGPNHWMFGRSASETHRDNMRRAKLGTTVPEDVRAKMMASHRAKYPNPSARDLYVREYRERKRKEQLESQQAA